MTKLLIITQKVNKTDPILGFFHRWLEEFAKHCDLVTIICLERGEYNLPSNVKVLSLGKEEHVSRFQYIIRFYKYIWQERGNYNAVFVHMNQIYVILGSLLWKLWGKRIALWYVHRATSLSLRIATLLTDIVFSASRESFRIKTKKLFVVGHGIDTERFTLAPLNTGVYKVVTAGRISQTKHILRMIEISQVLTKIEFVIAGKTITSSDERYFSEINDIIRQHPLPNLSFCGLIPHESMPAFLQSADLFINLSGTGSLDKAVLEAMSTGLNVITSNEAFKTVLPSENITSGEIKDVVAKVEALMSDRARRVDFRGIIVSQHSLQTLIPKLLNF